MKRERRQPTPSEWAAITSSRPVVRILVLPDRGTKNVFDEDFEGLGRMKLKYRDLTKDELNTDAVDGRVLKAGTVTDAHVQGRFAGSSLPQNTVYGSYNGNPGRLGVGDIGGMPDFSNFLKAADIAAFRTEKQIKNIIRNMVKKSALQ